MFNDFASRSQTEMKKREEDKQVLEIKENMKNMIQGRMKDIMKINKMESGQTDQTDPQK